MLTSSDLRRSTRPETSGSCRSLAAIGRHEKARQSCRAFLFERGFQPMHPRCGVDRAAVVLRPADLLFRGGVLQECRRGAERATRVEQQGLPGVTGQFQHGHDGLGHIIG